jgi:hypothetical protein
VFELLKGHLCPIDPGIPLQGATEIDRRVCAGNLRRASQKMGRFGLPPAYGRNRTRL